MQTAFFTLGSIYIGLKLAGAIIRGVNDFYNDAIAFKAYKDEPKQKRRMRQPIGFAVQTTEE